MDEPVEPLKLLRAGLQYCPALLSYLDQVEAEMDGLLQENDGLLQMVKEAEAGQERAERLLEMICCSMLCHETA